MSPSHPLLPITQKGLTRRQTADLLNGLAALVESYPADGIVLTVNIEVAATGSTPKTPKKAARKS